MRLVDLEQIVLSTNCPVCGAAGPPDRYNPGAGGAWCLTPSARRVPQLHYARVEAGVCGLVEDERREASGEGIWGYLRSGWCVDPGLHTIHEFSMKAFRAAVRRVYHGCACEVCRPA